MSLVCPSKTRDIPRHLSLKFHLRPSLFCSPTVLVSRCWFYWSKQSLKGSCCHFASFSNAQSLRKFLFPGACFWNWFSYTASLQHECLMLSRDRNTLQIKLSRRLTFPLLPLLSKTASRARSLCLARHRWKRLAKNHPDYRHFLSLRTNLRYYFSARTLASWGFSYFMLLPTFDKLF